MFVRVFHKPHLNHPGGWPDLCPGTGRLTCSPTPTYDETNNHCDEKYKEQNLRDRRCCPSDPAKSENAGNDSYYKKCKCPTEHGPYSHKY